MNNLSHRKYGQKIVGFSCDEWQDMSYVRSYITRCVHWCANGIATGQEIRTYQDALIEEVFNYNNKMEFYKEGETSN